MSTFIFRMSDLNGYRSMCSSLVIRFSKSNDVGPQERATTPSVDPLSSGGLRMLHDGGDRQRRGRERCDRGEGVGRRRR